LGYWERLKGQKRVPLPPARIMPEKFGLTVGLNQVGHVAHGQGDVPKTMVLKLPEDNLQDGFAVQRHQGFGNDLGHRRQAHAFAAGQDYCSHGLNSFAVFLKKRSRSFTVICVPKWELGEERKYEGTTENLLFICQISILSFILIKIKYKFF
jgi:hypothetical protein